MTKYDDSDDEGEQPSPVELLTKSHHASNSDEASSSQHIEEPMEEPSSHDQAPVTSSSILPSVNELQHELNQAIATSMEHSPLTWCFRASVGHAVGGPRAHGPTHHVPTVLRKRGQMAKASWRRAMRAGGPFAPGSIIGAVAADTHRRTAQGSSPHPPRSPNQLSPNLNSPNVFPSITSSHAAPLATTSRASMLTADDDASSFHSFHSATDTIASALAGEARQAFNEAGIHPQGGAPTLHHHHPSHHHYPPHKTSPLKPLQQHAAAAYAHAMKAKDRAIRFVRDLSQRGMSEGETSGNAEVVAESTEDMDRFLSHSTHPAVDAFRSGSLGAPGLGFGFSGGGFLFPWHLGVVTELQDAGVITKDTQISGASCGAIIVACVHSGLNLHSLVNELLSFAEDCRLNGTAGRLRYVIEHFMSANLPADAHLKCAGKTHIQLTRVFPYLKVLTVSEWQSKDDLVQAISCSCHIPAYNDGSLVFRYRGSLFIDGGVLKHLPIPPKVSFSAGVSCVPLKFLGKLPGANRLSVLRGLAISPDMFSDFPYEWQQLASLVLVPGTDPVLLSMIERGKQDARRWAEATGITGYLNGTLFVPRSPAGTDCNDEEEEDEASEYEEVEEGIAEVDFDEEGEAKAPSPHTELHRHHSGKDKGSRRRPKVHHHKRVVEVVGGSGSVSEHWDEDAKAISVQIIPSSSQPGGNSKEGGKSIKIRVKGQGGQPDVLLDVRL